MQSLSKKQVELIITEVDDARITLSHLADELVDHICCEVENLMNQGKDFEHAYDFVKQQTGTATLQKIQENTQFLIDKNYRRMKMTMKITGNISLAMLGIGTVMKLLHWPFSAFFLFFGFMVLCLIFFPSAIYTNYKELKVKSSKLLHLSILIGGILFMFGVLFKVMHLKGAYMLLLSGWIIIIFIFLPILLYVKIKESTTSREKNIITAGIVGLIIFELATMFKMFHWPGAAFLMVIGSILMVTFFIPLYTYSKFKGSKTISVQFIYISIITMFFILLTILLALNVSLNILNVFNNDVINSTKISNYLELKNQRIYNDFNSKSDSTKIKDKQNLLVLQSETRKLCGLIDSIQLTLIMAAEDVDKPVATRLLTNVNDLRNKTEMETVQKLMIGEGNNGMAFLLKRNINKYRETLQSITSSNSDLNKNIIKLLETNDVFVNQENVLWEQFTFGHIPQISSIAVLRDIEKRVKMVESQTIQHLITQK